MADEKPSPPQREPALPKDTRHETKADSKPGAKPDTNAEAKATPPPAGPTRKEKVPVGIVGVDLHEVERDVPADAPPAWPPNAELTYVGKPTSRVDGVQKVTGAARYTADVRLPGMLYGKRLCSPLPHARVKSIDTSAAEKHPGVRAVHVLERLTEGAQLRNSKEEPPSKYPLIRYAGQPIAGVAATSQAAADEAVRLIKVDYEPLPFVVDLDDAMKPDAPLVFAGPTEQRGTAGGGGAPQGLPQKGNIRGPNVGTPRGDVQKGLAEADVVVQGEFRTQVQTHSALETHGVVADWKPDGLTVYASTQGTSSVRDELAEVFQLPKNKVTVITEFMGGGFGAKFGAGSYGVLATHLSKKAGAPVRLMLDRKEEHLSVGNRPNSLQRLKVGAKKDGTLTAIHLESYGTGGISTGAGTGMVAERLYPCPNVKTEQYDVFTNAGPASAMRAPGAPQGAFALEQVVDELAEKLGMDPIALRDKIDTSGERNLQADARRAERRIGAERIGWAQRHKPGAEPGPIKRGIGMAQAVWPRIIDLDGSCEVRLNRDGSVELYSGVQDIGGGIRTALAQVVAEELGVPPKEIRLHIGNTSYPAGVGSGGSRTTGSMTPAARLAAYQVKQQLFAQVAPALNAKPEELAIANGKVVVKADPSRGLELKRAAAKLRTEQLAARASRPDDYGGFDMKRGSFALGTGGYGGVQFAQVAVDTETGLVKVEKVVAVHDCGRPVNPLAIQSQINGGVLQGISYALYENRWMDRKTGHMVNPNLEQYKIVGPKETPEIDVVVLEELRGRNVTDAGGIGEPANIATAAAVANAIYNAIGVRVRELPITPARVLAALSTLGTGGSR